MKQMGRKPAVVSRAIRMILAAWVLIALNGCAGGAWGRLFHQRSDNPTAILLFVNGEPILQGDLDRMVREIVSYAPRQYDAAAIQRMKPAIEKEALDNLIAQKLEDQAVVLEGIRPTDEQVEREVRILQDFLSANGSSLEQFMREKQENADEIRREIRAELAREMLIDKLAGLAPPSEDDCRADYEKNGQRHIEPEAVKLRQILLSYPAGETPSEQLTTKLYQQANLLRDRLLAGEDFAALAREYSNDASARDGGEMGWITRSAALPGPVLDAAFALPVGQLSQILTSDQGCRLLEVTERRARRVLTFEEARPLVERDILRQRRAERRPAMLRKLREKARIVKP